jgi:hypothetical protein
MCKRYSSTKKLLGKLTLQNMIRTKVVIPTTENVALTRKTLLPKPLPSGRNKPLRTTCTNNAMITPKRRVAS